MSLFNRWRPFESVNARMRRLLSSDTLPSLVPPRLVYTGAVDEAPSHPPAPSRLPQPAPLYRDAIFIAAADAWQLPDDTWLDDSDAHA
jgi:hypothetical protein